MGHANFIDYYQVLDIALTASPADIRTAYLSHAKQQHPDRGGSVAAMRALNHAYAVLRNPVTKQEYDVRYRKYVLHEDTSDALLSEGDEWDLSEVDDFFGDLYAKKISFWRQPVVLGFSIISAILLLFVVVAVSRMMTSSPIAQAQAAPKPPQKSRR